MQHFPSGAHRLALALPVVGLLCLAAVPASAAPTSSPPLPSPSAVAAATPDASQQATTIAQSQQQLQQAQAAATAQDTALVQAQQNLAGVQAAVIVVQDDIARYDAEIAADQQQIERLRAQLGHDKDELAAYLRAAYERGSDSGLAFIFSASSFDDLMARYAQVNQVSNRGTVLVRGIQSAQSSIRAALDDATQKRQALDVSQQQSNTEAALLTIEVQQVQALDQQAQTGVQTAQANVVAAVNNQSMQPYTAGGRAAVVYMAVTGVNFTIDTSLTQPSGETAPALNGFLNGTALQGLGGAFLEAEATYHVSARYLVAHAIEESAFGTSRIAQDKHNLFGYGANDSNPYTNAVSFPSFAAGIDFVASKVALNYLAPSGQYFHGATLRGMNVMYATDPNWAGNIARIANSFP